MTALHLQADFGPRHTPHRRAARDRIGNAARHVAATLREWRRRARERDELARLDERALLDIGLSRADAEFLANKPFWRE
jgi:uncharacterized protein YjiS (DUF1127 family)